MRAGGGAVPPAAQSNLLTCAGGEPGGLLSLAVDRLGGEWLVFADRRALKGTANTILGGWHARG